MTFVCRAADNWDVGREMAQPWAMCVRSRAASPEGRGLLEEALRGGRRIGAPQAQPLHVVWLRAIWLLAGHVDEARQHAHQALALVRQYRERGNEALALCQLGAVHTKADPPEVAQSEARYQEALALAEELGMRPLQAHCHHGLGTLYVKSGQREQARPALTCLPPSRFIAPWT